MSKIQGFFKTTLQFSRTKNLWKMVNPDLSVKILLQKCQTVIMEELVLEN